MSTYRVCESRTVAFAAILILSAVVATAAMQIKSITIPVPTDDDPVLLTGLDYPGAGWTIEFTSVRVAPDSDEGADPLKLVWTMVASSSRPMVQKVIVEIQLEDKAGKKLKAIKNFVIVKSNAERQEFPFKMKIKQADWERAHTLHIKTTFTVL
jgi:hypothetical protein